MKLYERINNTFLRYKDRPAVSVFSPPDSLVTITYGQLKMRVERFAIFMAKNGIKPGAFVMTYMNKSPQVIEAILATMINWGTASSLSSKLKPVQVLKLCGTSNSKSIVIDKPALISLLRLKEAFYTESQFIFHTSASELKKAKIFLEKADTILNILEYQLDQYNLDQYKNKKSCQVNYHDSKIPGFCLFTSGSTGYPKGVLISRDDLLKRALTEVEDYKLTENDCLLSLLPFSFDVGLNQLFSCFFAGAHLVILNSWFPKDIITSIKFLKITGISSVPSIWIDLLSFPKKADFVQDIKTLRYITVSGGDLARDQLLKLKQYFKNIHIYKTYGQTETFRSGILMPHDYERKITSVGKPPKGTEVYILDQKGMIVPPNIEGEIVHCGDGTMIGYKGDKKETRKKLRDVLLAFNNSQEKKNLVFTGDRGKFDEDGYLYVLGRRDGMIKTSGHRVYPREVENCILEHEKVKYAAVVGIKDDHLGQAIIAEVVPKETLNTKELITFLKDRLASYMLPRDIHLVKNLPMSESGKIKYGEIKSKYEKDV